LETVESKLLSEVKKFALTPLDEQTMFYHFRVMLSLHGVKELITTIENAPDKYTHIPKEKFTNLRDVMVNFIKDKYADIQL
jgi:hypothetical protein